MLVRNQQIFGYGSSALLILGTFMPIVSLPMVGTLTYFANGQGDGWLVLVCAAAAIVLTALRKFKFVWIPGGIALILLIVVFARIMGVINEARAALDNLEGNPFKGLAESLVGSVQIQFGWIVLVIGALGLVVGPFLKFTKPSVESFTSDVAGDSAA